MEIQYFNSQEAAKILGVNVSTIKRWTEEGKLECIKTAGGHRKFLMEHLAKFLEDYGKKKAKANLFPVEDTTDLELSRHILKGDFPFLQDFLFRHALEVNRVRLHQVLSGLYLGQYPLHEIYDHLLTPVLHRLGDLWEAGQLSVIEEHLAAQAIRDGIIRLQGQIRIPRDKIGTVLCLNLAGELHDLPLKMVDHILEQRGFQVLFSGQITPAAQIDSLFQKWQPQRIYISSTYVEDLPTSQWELDQILEIAHQHGSQVFVGGQGFDRLSFDHPAVVARLSCFEKVTNM
ncbi:MAG: excisionase family DNA-binding protein [Calditrichia bacterium]